MNLIRKYITVVLADNHEVFRVGLKNILRREKDPCVKVLSEAPNGAALLKAVEHYQPDLVFMDTRIPLVNGVQACKIIRQQYPATGVIAISLLNDLPGISAMIGAGATGSLVKTCTADEIREAISKVSNGKTYYSVAILDSLNSNKDHVSSMKPIKKVYFSNKEISIIKLMCKELTTKEIASSLGMAKRTVEDYRHHIQEKVGAKNMVGIAVYAILNDIVKVAELQAC